MSHRILSIVTLSAIFLIHGSDSDAFAERLFGTVPNADQLLEIDKSTGITTPVGPHFGYEIQGLAFSNSGVLFGSVFEQEKLVTVNQSTGAVTEVGALGFGHVSGLAFDSNGTLFGIDFVADQLLRIDTATGAATAIAPLSPVAPNRVAASIGGLAFDSNDTLFGSYYDTFTDSTNTDLLVTINTTTGEVAPIGSHGFGNIQGLSFDSSGTLFGVDSTSLRLVTIDTTTGVGTGVGAFGSLGTGGIRGLAFGPVPEPTTCTLALTALCLAMSRRRAF